MLDILVAFVFGLCLVLAAIALLGIIRSAKPKSPAIQAVIDALMPYIYRAILAGQTLALYAESELDRTLTGQDKKAIADSVYDALPDYLIIGLLPIPIGTIRLLIPRERFETLVKDAYESASAFVKRNEAFLKSQTDKLLPPVINLNAQTASVAGLASGTIKYTRADDTKVAPPSDPTPWKTAAESLPPDHSVAG